MRTQATILMLLLAMVCITTMVSAQPSRQPLLLKDVGIDQKIGAQLPLDLPFINEDGRTVTLRQFTGKPTILALIYYQCPSLCNMVLTGIVQGTKPLPFNAGEEYQVIAISFDPRENYLLARDKKRNYLKEYGRAGAENGWHFLTDSTGASRSIAEAAGFHYKYDPHTNQYVHPSAMIILTPDGRVSRYFYGISYPSRDVKLGLMDASRGKIGSPLDQVQLLCFHYDAGTGRYGFAIMSALRIFGLITLGSLLVFMTVMFRRDRHATRG